MTLVPVPPPERPPSPEFSALIPLPREQLNPPPPVTQLVVVNVLKDNTREHDESQALKNRLNRREELLRKHAKTIASALSDQIVEKLVKAPHLQDKLGIKLEQEPQIDLNLLMQRIKSCITPDPIPANFLDDENTKDYVWFTRQEDELKPIFNDFLQLLEVHNVDFEKEGCTEVIADSLKPLLKKSIENYVENRSDKSLIPQKVLLLCSFLSQVSSVGSGVGVITTVSMFALNYLKNHPVRL